MDVTFGCIASIIIPPDWIAEDAENSALLAYQSFHPPQDVNVELCIFQKTQGLESSQMARFRTILNEPAHKLVESEQELTDLTPVLGNAGNNQWSNKSTGAAGPNFRFASGESIKINERPVLSVRGTFIEPESRKAVNEYCGIFVDSGTDYNRVLELYLLVPSSSGYFQFEKYLKVFNQALSTIAWK